MRTAGSRNRAAISETTVDSSAARGLDDTGQEAIKGRLRAAVGNVQDIFGLEFCVGHLAIHDLLQGYLSIGITNIGLVNHARVIQGRGTSLATRQRHRLQDGHAPAVLHEEAARPANITEDVDQAGARDDDLVSWLQEHIG